MKKKFSTIWAVALMVAMGLWFEPGIIRGVGIGDTGGQHHQQEESDQMNDEQVDDKQVDGKQMTNKNFLGAALQTSAVNLSVWLFNRYVTRQDWARVGLDSMWANFRQGLVWDSNSFNCNSMEHAYHGSLYYSAARVNGLNLWESSLYSVGGSLMWEFMLETEHASTNDVVYTGFAGMMLGEILYRISGQLLSFNTTGAKRNKWAGVLGGLVNPVVGFNRMLSANYRRTAPMPRAKDFDLKLFLGANSSEQLAALDLRSRQDFDTGALSPYDFYEFYFSLRFPGELHLDVELISQGILLGNQKAVGGGGENGGGYRVIGLFAGYDAFNTRQTGRQALVGPAFGWNLATRTRGGMEMVISCYLTGGLGATTASHALVHGEHIYHLYGETHQFSHNEDAYYMGPGASIKLYGEVTPMKRLQLYFRLLRYLTASFQAKHAYESLEIIRTGLRFNLFRNVFVGCRYAQCTRIAHYRSFPRIRRSGREFTFNLGLHFN